MTTRDRSPAKTGFRALFEASPETEVHTSAAAVTALLLGLGALLATPFSIMFAVAAILGLLGLVSGFAGVVATSRPLVAGGALVPLGLTLSSVALALLGLRYLDLDTAFGDPLGPSVLDLLERLNSQFSAP